MTVQLSAGQGRHVRVAECTLGIADWKWPLAERHGDEIGRNWQRRLSESPRLFDGAVYLFKDYGIDQGRLAGTLFQTDFKTLLYWRQLPFATSDSVREASGSSLIRSAEGHLLFARQTPGQLNSGLIYPPSGIIDARDVRSDAIDIDASIRRELAEETGLTEADVARVPGYVVSLIGVHVTIGIEWRSPLPATELRQRMLRFIAAEANPELEDIVIVENGAPIPEELMLPHARVFARALLEGE